MKIEYNPDNFNLAAIDIGSNAARLLIKSATRQEDGTFKFMKLQFIRFPLRLGIDVFSMGKISDERESQFIRMIKAFRQLMIIYNVVDYRACATSALRDAKNGQKIIKKIKDRTGIEIDIITGEEEAKTIYDNHIDRLLYQSKNPDAEDYLYMDVGGGSTEISFISNGELKASHSYNVGTLRMLGGAVSLEAINSMADDICSMIRQNTEPAEDETKKNTPKVTIIGSGGNILKLSRLVPKKTKLKDRISLQQLQSLYGQLASLTVEERMQKFELRPDRADVIVPAAQLFMAVASAVGATEIAVPALGLADGIINELAAKHSEITNDKN